MWLVFLELIVALVLLLIVALALRRPPAPPDRANDPENASDNDD
ncbi:MAG: hypothetical protein ACYC5W_11085 [Thauera sp.]